MNFGKKIMRNRILICVYWKITGRLEVYTTMTKLYEKHEDTILGVSKWTLYRKNLFEGWENDVVKIQKIEPN